MPMTIEIPSSVAEEIQSALPISSCTDENEFIRVAIQAYLGALRNQRKVMQSDPESIRTDIHISFDYSRMDSVLKIARSELNKGANGNVIKLVLKAFVSELNRLWALIDRQMENRTALFPPEISDDHVSSDIYQMKRLLLKLINASQNLQSEAVLTQDQLSLLEQGIRLLKAGNLNADILKDYSTQLRRGEIDTMVRPQSDEEVDKLISLYMEKLGKGET